MKIQMQHAKFEPAAGGIENYFYYVSKTLIEMGHEPSILCEQERPELPLSEIYEGVPITRHPKPQWQRGFREPIFAVHVANAEKTLQTFIRSVSAGIDLIIARHSHYAYASCKAALDIPVVFAQANVWPKNRAINFGSALRGFNKLVFNLALARERSIEKSALELCDHVVVLSESKKTEIADYHHFAKERINVIPPGIDLVRFKPGKKDTRLLRDLKIPEEAKTVLTVGRLFNQKNQAMLIRAMAEIESESCYLVIVGDGPERAHLEQLARELNLADRIRFVGFQQRVEQYYRSADVFVLPSIYEGFGHVYLEAMACGLPCIGLAPDYPHVVVATDEIIEADQNGFLADPYSTQDLAEKITTVLTDDALRSRMGKESRRICEQTYSWETHVRTLLRLCN
jgi:glycosyltransferase involved in cell wall biosynthesis